MANVNMAVRTHYDHLALPIGAAPLTLAMSWSSWRVVAVLLTAGAYPFSTSGPRGLFTPLSCAGIFARVDNIRPWCKYFNNQDIESTDQTILCTPLGVAIKYGGGRAATSWRAFVDHGANVKHTSGMGGTVLHLAASNPDADEKLITMMVRSPQVKAILNQKMCPRTNKWKAIFLVSRILTRLGLSKKSMLVRLLHPIPNPNPSHP